MQYQPTRFRAALYCAAAAPAEMHNQADKEQNQEYEEQNLCDTRRCYRDSAEAKEPGNKGDQQENQSIVNHVLFILSKLFTSAS
jgi:hypothetical protein